MQIAVAVSGGRDSTALLHCAARCAREIGATVLALHVNHGLHADSDAWARHVIQQARRWSGRGLPVQAQIYRVAERPPRGASVEAWARRQRYAGLAEMARQHGCNAVLLAHHRSDQAETVLLQMLRRAQPGALGAMTAVRESDGIRWYRPWLDRSRDEVERYVRRHRLRYIDDPSNADTRFARNRLRQHVWPALTAAFPDAEASLLALAGRMQAWSEVVDEVVQADMATALDGTALRVPDWLALPPPRRELLLRQWLLDHAPGAATDPLVARLLAEVPASRVARWPVGDVDGVPLEVALYRGRMSILDRRNEAAVPLGLTIDLSRPGRYLVPEWAGELCVADSTGPGVPFSLLSRVLLRPRQGGEQFQAGPRRPPRALKKQYQTHAVPPWARTGPLLWAGPQLVFVPGLGIDARVLVDGAQGRALIEWHPHRGADIAE